jgi:hypothetical protein
VAAGEEVKQNSARRIGESASYLDTCALLLLAVASGFCNSLAAAIIPIPWMAMKLLPTTD